MAKYVTPTTTAFASAWMATSGAMNVSPVDNVTFPSPLNEVSSDPGTAISRHGSKASTRRPPRALCLFRCVISTLHQNRLLPDRPRASGAAVATTSRLGRCTCQLPFISRSIDNAASDEGQCVQIHLHASHRPEGFSGES